MNLFTLISFLSVFCLMSYGIELNSANKGPGLSKQKRSEQSKSPLKSIKKTSLSKKRAIETDSGATETSEKIKEAQTNKLKQSPSNKDSMDLVKEKNDIISEKIKKVFVDFLEILESKSINSKEYIKAVHFLENSLYDEASFETLKILAKTYENKEDFRNQIKVLKRLSCVGIASRKYF